MTTKVVSKEQVNNQLSQITTEVENRPEAMIVYGVEGIGKTSFAAQAPDCLVIMTRGETGLNTLINNGALEPKRHFPEVKDWKSYLDVLSAIEQGDSGARALIIDCMNGLAELCSEYVCQTKFNGDWGTSGFMSYGAGYTATLKEWESMIVRLDAIRDKGLAIIGIAHAQVKLFSNPEGKDYDRYTPDMHKNVWACTARWADIILFMNYHTTVTSEGFKNKAKGGDMRVAYTQRTASWDAKNRHNMPTMFSLGNSAKEGWANFLVAKNN